MATSIMIGMANDIEILRARVERLRRLHLKALAAYHAYVEMLRFTAPNVVGQERAEANAEAISMYKGYLNTARAALNTEMHLSLAKIYDDHKDALHITKLVNYVNGNKKNLVSDDRIRDVEVQELTQVYEGLTKEDRADISATLDAAEERIKRLKDIRDNIIAHEDMGNPDDVASLTYDDLNDLMSRHAKILNVIANKYYGETTIYDWYRDQVVNDTNRLLNLIAEEYDKRRKAFP